MKRLVLWGISQEEEGHAGAWRALAFQIPTYIIGLDSLWEWRTVLFLSSVVIGQEHNTDTIFCSSYIVLLLPLCQMLSNRSGHRQAVR